MTETSIQELIDQLVAAEEWPDPNLLQAILDRGEAGIELLITVLESDDDSYAKDYVEAMWLMLQQQKADEFVIGHRRSAHGSGLI